MNPLVSTGSQVVVRAPPRSLLDVLVGFAVASFIFIPVVRAVTAVPEGIYLFPLAFLCAALVSVRSRSRVLFPFPVRMFVLLGISLCLWLLLTSYWSISPAQVQADAMLISYWLALLTLVPLFLSTQVLRWTLNWIVVAGLFTADVVFMSYYDVGTLRGYGIFVSEFYLTASVLLGASLVGSVARLSATRHVNLRTLGVICVLLGGLALSLGRMALLSSIALMIILALYGVLSRRHRRSVRIPAFRPIVRASIIFLIAAGLLWGAFQVERTKRRLERLFFSPSAELEGRRGDIWATAWQNIHSAPIVGHGLGSNGLLSVRSDVSYPHNLVLQVWLDAGIIGVLLLIVTLCVPLVVFWNHRRSEGARMALPFLAMYLFFIMQYQVSYNAYTARSIFVMGLLTTFAASYPWTRRRASKAGAQ